MKQIFNPSTNESVRDAALLIVRIVIALLLITHGFPKLQMLLANEPVQFVSIFGMTEHISLSIAIFAEFFCAMLVMIGFATRIATIPIIAMLLVIILHIHSDDPLTKKELPILYLVSYSFILLMGAGKYSIDYLVYRNNRRSFSY